MNEVYRFLGKLLVLIVIMGALELVGHFCYDSRPTYTTASTAGMLQGIALVLLMDAFGWFE